MEEVRTMTEKDVLIETVKILENIQVPARLAASVGVPLQNAIGNLELILDAINKNEQSQEKKEE